MQRLLRWSERIFKTDMRYVARGGFWLSAGHVISMVSGLILSVMFARMLSQDVYGVYKYVLSMAGILAIPNMGGIDAALSQAIARGHDASFWPGLRIRIGWGLLGSLASVLVALYYFYAGNDGLAFSFLIITVFIPVSDTFGIYSAVLYGKQDIKNLYTYNSIVQTVSTVALVATLLCTQEVYFILLAYFLPITLSRFFLMLVTIKKHPLNTKDESGVLSYGKHLTLMNVLGIVASQIDKVLVFQFVGAANLAIYSYASALPEQIRSFSKGIFNIGGPRLAAISGEEKFKKSLSEKTFTLTVIFAIIIFIYVIASPYIFKLLYPLYMDSVYFSRIYSIGLITIPAISLLSTKISVEKNVPLLYKSNVLFGIVSIVLSLTFIKYFGLFGIIFKNTVAWIFLMFLNYYYFTRPAPAGFYADDKSGLKT